MHKAEQHAQNEQTYYLLETQMWQLIHWKDTLCDTLPAAQTLWQIITEGQSNTLRITQSLVKLNNSSFGMN